MRGSRIFCQFYLVLSLFDRLQRGPMVLLLKKIYIYCTKDPGGGGGCPTFSRRSKC